MVYQTIQFAVCYTTTAVSHGQITFAKNGEGTSMRGGDSDDQKQGLREDVTVLMWQLVMNGQMHMAGTVLYKYFIRCWKLDDEHAAYYMRRYF